ncbi:tetratricopeptide repeat protein [Catenulispora acidiphila]|uniref:tetratricopeptide repeat protein n=1 Tax=Catenulispora acidiphila TaxID=304895 RepID=UPI00117D331F|nr:tetratricopeptide repeat protein [Catenulispora acidiphila]
MLGRGRGTDPQWITQEFAKAEDLAAVGQQERARDRYARLARRLSSVPEDLQHYRGLALLGEAETILALGIFTDAMARFREAYPLLTEPFRQLPRWLVRQFAEERLRAEDGDLKPIIDFLKAITYGLEPGDEDTAIRTVMWLQKACTTGPTAQREATARAALAALPGVDWPVLALTTMMRRDGRVKEAEDLLAAAVPGGSGELWFRWGIQLSTLLRYDDAISAYDEAFRRGTGPASPWSRGAWLRPEALLFRGLAHQQMGRTDQAETDLRTASQYAPQDPRIHYSLGRLAVQLGADDLAWNHFSNSLAVEAAFAPARLGLALLREQSGRPAEAIAHYQAALRHDAHSRAARIRLGAVLLAAGRRKEAQGLLEPESGQSSYWGGMATFHYGLAQLRANNPAGAIDTWDRLGTTELRDWTAVARDREARKRLGSDPTAARLQWQIAYLDSPEVIEHRIALREAALREAAWMLMSGREIPDNREKAAVALDLAASMPTDWRGDGTRGRQNRLRALVDLAGGTTTDLETFLAPDGRMRDRCHLAVAALLDDRIEDAETLLAELPEDPDCDPAVARARALYAERTGHWYDAVQWYQRFLGNDIANGSAASQDVDADADSGADTGYELRDDDTQSLDIQEIANAGPLVAAERLAAEAEPDDEEPPLPCVAVADVECGKDAVGSCAGCGREGCRTHLFRPSGLNSYRCEKCAGPALQSLLYAARKAGVPDEAERTLTSWADALVSSALTPPLRRQLALMRAEAGDLDGALVRLPADVQTERVELLIRRAASAIEKSEPYRALGDLRSALQIQPDQPEALAALEALSEYSARQHADEGRHEEAFAGYLALVREEPTNARLLHALGLSAYQLARSGNKDEHWMWTIGCLVTALYAPDFWTQVVGVGDVEADRGQIEQTRRTLIDELKNDLRFADLAAYRGGDEVDAWSVRLGMDVLACEADLPALSPIRISPTLEALLRQQPETPALAEWRELADATHAADSDGAEDDESVRIAALYGPLGPQHFLYEDSKFEPAIAALDTVAESDRDAAWTALLRKTLVMRGMELHLDEQWAPALECIARAASLDPDRKPEGVWVEIAAESGLNAARELMRRAEEGERPVSVDATPTVNMAATSTAFIADATKTVNIAAAGLSGLAASATGDSASGAASASAPASGDGDVPAPVSVLQSVVDVLERALSVAPDVTALQRELGVAHMRRTRELRSEVRDYVLALSHARRAVELRPDDKEAAALLEVVLAERAGALTKPGPDGDLLEAVQWWQELSEMDGSKSEYHAGLSYALKLLACSAALGGRRALAVDRMTWGLLADKTWTGDPDLEAPRVIATLLIADAMDERTQRPFNDRAHRLRTALAYRDTKELRDLMAALWRNEATFQWETRHYGLCASLLEEAEALDSGNANPDASTTLNLRVPSPDDPRSGGMQPFHWHRYPRARALLKRTVDHYPDDDELRELHARSAAPEDPAST